MTRTRLTLLAIVAVGCAFTAHRARCGRPAPNAHRRFHALARRGSTRPSRPKPRNEPPFFTPQRDLNAAARRTMARPSNVP